MSALLEEPELEIVFDADYIASLADDYYAENEELGDARLKFLADKKMCLTVLDYDKEEKERTVSVYLFEDSEQIFTNMDKNYRNIIRDGTSGSDFWDAWKAMMFELNLNYLVSKEVFEV